MQNFFAPASTAASLGLTLSGPALDLVRVAGIFQLTIAVLALAGLWVTSADGRFAIDISFFIGYASGCIFAIWQIAIGQFAPLFFVQLLIAAVLTIAYGVFAFGRRSAVAVR